MTELEYIKNLKSEYDTYNKYSNEYHTLDNQRFGGKPQKPEFHVQKHTYENLTPKSDVTFKLWEMFLGPIIAICIVILGAITQSVSFLAIGTLIFPVSFLWIPIYISLYFHVKNKDEQAKAKTPEWQAHIAQMNKEAEDLYNQKYAEYQEACKKYEFDLNIWYTEYNKWYNAKTLKLKEISAKVDEYRNRMQRLFDYNVIPNQFRDYEAVSYIYSVMMSSNYSIEAAIVSYENKLNRDLQYQRIYEQQIQNERLAEQADIMYDQNDLLAEQNEIARKTRRDINLGNLVNTMQNHNRNKLLKESMRK